MTFAAGNNTTFALQAQYRGGLYTKADVNSWIKKQWATMVRRELEQDLLLRQFIMNVSFPQGKVGDRVTIPTLGRLGVNRKTAGLPVTLQKGNTGAWSIDITQHVESSFMVEDITAIMLDPSGLLAQNLAKEAAYAIKRDLDAFILGLRAAIQNIGGSQVIVNSADGTFGASVASAPLTIASVLRAKRVLDELDVPTTDRVLIVSPAQYAQLLAQDKTQNMFYRTSAVLENGIVGTLLGIPVYMTSMIGTNSITGFLNGTTAIPTPGVTGSGQIYYPDQDTAATLPVTWGTTANAAGDPRNVHTALLLHREAFALAMLQEPKTEYSRETLYLSDAVVTSTLYGARVYRPTNAVIIHTNAVTPTT
jgi:hypothetical protein